MPRIPDVVMAQSIYDDNELLPKALVIRDPDLKESVIDPDMDRSNNRVHGDNCDDCNEFCDIFCGSLLICCCICGACDF